MIETAPLKFGAKRRYNELWCFLLGIIDARDLTRYYFSCSRVDWFSGFRFLSHKAQKASTLMFDLARFKESLYDAST